MEGVRRSEEGRGTGVDGMEIKAVERTGGGGSDGKGEGWGK